MRKLCLTVLVFTILTAMVAMPMAGCTPNYNDYYYKPNGTVYANNDPIFQKGFGTDNNGYEKSGKEVNRLTSVVPNDRQLNYLEMEYYSFIHFGMNTFTGREWGTGKESPSEFNPTTIDTDQWCETILASGSKGVIFTAKHHDGFCLWQTETTEHSIKNSPYKNGKGDIVKELSESCKKYGLKMGLYLSPWDMNCPLYGKNEYNDFFKAQLTELLDKDTYGDIFSIWFDGARGEDADIDPDFEYDMKGYEEIINSLQSNCVSALQGSDVRWVGNEAGVSRENEWSVISDGAEANLEYQNNADGADKLQQVWYNAEDVGSRDLLKKYKKLIFKPAEVDVSIHQGWFYHEEQNPKELDHLMKIYHKSVGGNSNLLLNICPSTNGIIEERDVVRLTEFGNAIKESKAHPITISDIKIGDATDMVSVDETTRSAIISEDRNAYKFKENEYILDFAFDKPHAVTRVDLREDLRYSQRIEKYDIYARVDGGWKLLAEAGNVGNRRSVLFDPESLVTTDAIRIVVRQSRNVPVLRSVGIYSNM